MLRLSLLLLTIAYLGSQISTQAQAHGFSEVPTQKIRAYPIPDQEKKAFEQVPEPARNALRGVVDNLKVWPVGSSLDVCFMAGSEALRQFFVETAKLWTDATSITFDFGAGPHYRDCQTLRPSQIRVAFATEGNWSYVGTDSVLPDVQNKPSLNIGDAAGRDFAQLRQDHLRAVILHELGHALGLEHEHQSPESDCEQEFDWPAIYQALGGPPNNWSSAEIDHNLRALVKSPRRRVTPYDPKSIMHYALPPWMFKARDKSKCFVPENLALSDGDREIIRSAYPASTQDQQRYLTTSGARVEKLLEQSGITREQAKAIAELARTIVEKSNPDMGFTVKIDHIREEENKQEGFSQRIEGDCNVGIQGVQGDSTINIQGGCNR